MFALLQTDDSSCAEYTRNSKSPQEGQMPSGLWLISLLVIVSLLRLAVAAGHPLYETEMYYYLWTHHLDFGYMDHPPMLAWLNWLGDFWGPPHSLAARFHCVVSHFLTVWMIYLLGRNMFDSRRIGLLGSVIYSVIPIYSVFAVNNEPDVPLILFWVATLLCFERATHTNRPHWWLVCGLAGGGLLLSKFHGFILIGSLFMYLLASRKNRPALTTPWPWIAAVIALIVFLPNILWNARHEWITYQFQFFRHAKDSDFQPDHIAAVILLPLVYLSPWIYVVACKAAWLGYSEGIKKDNRSWALGFWASVPLFLLFLLASMKTSVKIHWTSPAFVALCPLVAAIIADWKPTKRLAFLVVPAVVTAMVYGYLLHPMSFSRKLPNSLVPSFLRLEPDGPLRKDYAARTFGWPELGERLQRELSRIDSASPKFIMARRFDRAASAAFWAESPDLAYVADPGPKYRQRSREPDPRSFLLWDTPFLHPGVNGIYVLESTSAEDREREVRYLKNNFRHVGERIRIPVAYKGFVWREWELVPCQGWLGE